MAVREHPELFLVRPNIGQPLILLHGQLDEGFTMTFAGKTDWMPTYRECLQWIKGDSPGLWLKKNGVGHFNLWVAQVSDPRLIPAPQNDPPLSATEFQYKAGFRWEFDVEVEAHPHIPPQEWPQMLDITFSQKYWHPDQRKWVSKDTRNHHAVYVDERFPRDVDSFTLLHVTDLHVAGRNDRIPQVLAEVRDGDETQQLLHKYRNFNDNLRAVIAYANRKVREGELVLVVATGDIVDYYQDTIPEFIDPGATKIHPDPNRNNFEVFGDILTGRDERSESLLCPIFTILGNHDYLKPEPPLYGGLELLGMIIETKGFHGNFGLTKTEGAEYDHWSHGCPPISEGFPRPLRGMDARRAIKRHAPYAIYLVDLNPFEAYHLTDPKYDHLRTYLTEICYDTDFRFSVGRHHFVCLNTGQDIVPTLGEMLDRKIPWPDITPGYSILGDNVGKAKEDFYRGGTHTRGITDQHRDLLEAALEIAENDDRSIVFCFTHAPLLNLPYNRTVDIQILFEDSHSKQQKPPPDNIVTVLLAQMIRDRDMPADWREHAHEGYSNLTATWQAWGYPQGETPYLKEGLEEEGWRGRGWLSFECADGDANRFIRDTVTRWGGRPVVVLSGHTHAAHEFRVSEVTRKGYCCHLDDYSGTLSADTAHSLTTASDKAAWLADHAPLFMTSGGLKKETAKFREIVVTGEAIQSMLMVTLKEIRTLFESRLYPGRFIHLHEVYKEVVFTEPLETYDDVRAATFKVVPGLADSHHFSFECITAPGRYLHKSDKIVAAKKSYGTEYGEHATFKIVPALTGEPYPSVSIESYAYPGEYWQFHGHAPFVGALVQLEVLPSSPSEEFNKAATFRMHGRHSVPVARGITWQDIGDAVNVSAMATLDNKLYAATKDNKLWMREPVISESPWTHIGHANNVASMAALNGKLYAATKDNKLWMREPVPRDVPWRHIGHANNVVAMAVLNGKLLGVTPDSRLWMREPIPRDVPWQHTGFARPDVAAMTVFTGRAFVATHDKGFWIGYFVSGGHIPTWKPIVSLEHTPIALASVKGTFFLVMSDGRLWFNNILWMQ
jgi:hypothetical protein